ncbi:diguanylate cyclase [Thermoleophilia bacterium SCSIO 60948]|nr:diguanylate cyclase [Thermoleophilia bacterium SCSIO 60948]
MTIRGPETRRSLSDPRRRDGHAAQSLRAGEQEHSALLRVAAACAGANQLDDVLELAAEEALLAVGADSLSVGRFDRDARSLQVLINVGELSELEERFPEDENYPLESFPLLARMLEDGEPYFTAVDAHDADPTQVRLLGELGRSSDLAVPIIVEDLIWGEVWAAKGIGEPAFRAEDVSLLELIAGQIATAITRAEMFGRVSRLAYEDPLTGLPNRRAFEERLDRALARLREGDSLALLVCDLDGLKQINDTRGHAAGDRALKTAAQALVRTAAGRRGAFAARLSGDEFCVLLEGRDLFGAVSMGMAVLESIDSGAAGRESISLSCGAASAGFGDSGSELLRAADAALYAAKRRGGGRVCSVAETATETLVEAVGSLRREDSPMRELDRVVDAIAGALEDAGPEESAIDRLEVVASAFMQGFDFASFAISIVPPRGDHLIDIANGWNRDADALQSVRFAPASEQYPLADYPQSAELISAGCGSFSVLADDPEADPAEAAMLAELRMSSVVTAVSSCTEGSFMVELFGDERTHEPERAERALRLLVQSVMPPLHPDHASSATAARIELAERVTAHARELAAAHDPHEAAVVTSRHLAAAYGCHVVHVVERRGDRLALVGEAGSPTPGTWDQAATTGLIGRALSERAAVISSDVQREPAYRGTEATRGVRSELVVPIVADGEDWGALNLEHLDVDAFAIDDVAIVEAFAAQLAARLEVVGTGAELRA